MMVGESFDEDVHEDINGAVVGIRPRGDRLALWTSTSKNADLVKKIG